MTAGVEQADNLLAFAEKATLGGLLLAPGAVATVARWLRPGDFIDHWNRETYAAILDRPPRPITAVEVGRDLVARLGPRRADLPRVHALLTATPDRPNPVHYAQMVLESGIRHQTQALGVLLQAGARLTGTNGSARLLTDAARVVNAVLTADLTRWDLASRPAPQGEGAAEPARLAEVAPVVIPDWRPLALGADRALTAHPAPGLASVRQRERDFIAALITHPEEVRRTAWLRPEMLTDRAWRTAYISMLELAEHGTPIDGLTLAWEIHRASPQHGPGPSLTELQEHIDNARGVDPRFLAIGVAADVLDRLAGHTVASIRTASTNPGLDVRDLLGTARVMTTSMADLAAAAPSSTSDRSPASRSSTQQAVASQRQAPRPAEGAGPSHLRLIR